VFTNDCAMLVVATGWWENTGQVWTDTNKVSVGNQWGRAPVFAEVVPFTLTLPVGTNYVSAWALDERGQRRTALPVSGDSTATTLVISTNSGSLWYEVNVSRWFASYDLWRTKYFTSEEQADPAISGEAATPDGDRIPNLLKYYLGLPGRSLASAESAPYGSRLAFGTAFYPAISYQHDRLVMDVTCTPQTSLDLADWLSGPTATHAEKVLDLGTQEQITVRSLAPLDNFSPQYMRLELQRN